MKFNPQKDYYATLGLSQTADISAIQHAYKTMVARYHPDRHQGNDLEELAKEKLVEINEAYEVLSKPQLKSGYDAARASHRKMPPPHTGGNVYTPESVPKASGNSLRKLLVLIVFIAAMPFVLRFVRSPRAAAVIAVAVLLAWLGPKMLKRLKK